MSDGFKSGLVDDGIVKGGRYHVGRRWLYNNFGATYHESFFHGSTGHFLFDDVNNVLYVNYIPFNGSVAVTLRNYDTTQHKTNEGYFSMAPTKIKRIANADRFDYQVKVGL